MKIKNLLFFIITIACHPMQAQEASYFNQIKIGFCTGQNFGIGNNIIQKNYQLSNSFGFQAGMKYWKGFLQAEYQTIKFNSTTQIPSANSKLFLLSYQYHLNFSKKLHLAAGAGLGNIYFQFEPTQVYTNNLNESEMISQLHFNLAFSINKNFEAYIGLNPIFIYTNPSISLNQAQVGLNLYFNTPQFIQPWVD